MRILVGTLFSGENELDECVDAISRQSHANWGHFIIRNLLNKDAHDALYTRFMDNASDVDLFTKVDADMVIAREDLLARIVDKFLAAPQLQRLSIAVHDFFSDRLIYGLHTFRNTVRWQKNDESLFVDCLALHNHQGLDDDSELAPAAVHCKNPSLFQAFHYGAHKGLKIAQRRRQRFRRVHLKMRDHWDIMEATHEHFLESGDIRLGMACLGAELALRGRFQPSHLDYGNPFLKDVFREFEQHSTAEVEAAIKRLRYTNGGFLPSRIRRDWLWYKNSPKHLSTSAVCALVRRITTG